jgi:SagB-type dehydrogenase family enzyme
MPDPQAVLNREYLRDTIRKRIDFSQTDQSRRVPMPPVQKPAYPGAPLVDLPRPGEWQGVGTVDLAVAIAHRQSRRVYQPQPITLDELAFLLWATQGVRARRADGPVLRTVPSAGCRHSFETYVAALRVSGLEQGIYRYLPMSHQLVLERSAEGLADRLTAAAMGQAMAGRAAATFVWTTIPYRTEWRYGAASHKVIALDAGHVCQNLYLACEAIGCGTCAIAAYDQQELDALLGLDGQDEFAVYLAPVGKVRA